MPNDLCLDTFLLLTNQENHNIMLVFELITEGPKLPSLSENYGYGKISDLTIQIPIFLHILKEAFSLFTTHISKGENSLKQLKYSQRR